jgi:hypothetical protein
MLLLTGQRNVSVWILAGDNVGDLGLVLADLALFPISYGLMSLLPVM